MGLADSASDVLARLHAGDEDAAAEVFNRFAGRLAALAREHLHERVWSKVDPEDILQSVFRSFFTRHREGQFALESWGELWGLLSVITLRKCCNRGIFYGVRRRDAAREIRPDRPTALALDREPTPAEAAALADLVAELTCRLDVRDRQVLELHLQGHTAEEIAARIGRSLRTVWRSLARIRARAEDVLPPRP
jgi:RNA polymerase sigma-70 factor (ECF subfamily)